MLDKFSILNPPKTYYIYIIKEKDVVLNNFL